MRRVGKGESRDMLGRPTIKKKKLPQIIHKVRRKVKKGTKIANQVFNLECSRGLRKW